MKKILGILGVLLLLTTMICVSGEYRPIPGDINHDGRVSNEELLIYINFWASGRVSDTNLLISIDHWAIGRYHTL